MFGLGAEQINAIKGILSQFSQIECVKIYGSRAMNRQKKASDIDLALMGHNIDLQIINKIYIALDELLLPYKFDISDYDKIENKELKNHIDRIGQVIYTKESSSIQ